ncbi:MAG: hypothetical protein IJQ34_02215 [Kiritimatiellae bacterium]|nr:hypothetical protein [Kiritimatiellia bacterium]
MGYTISSRAARALTSLLKGQANSSGVRRSSAAVSPDSFPLPFTVRWSARENAGDGEWVIFLPTLANLVYYGEEAISTITGVTASQILPSGWYVIDNLSSTSASGVWLVISVTSSATTAKIDAYPTTPAPANTTVYNIRVASIATDSTSGKKTVKQYLASAISLGGGSGDPDNLTLSLIPSGETGAGKLQLKDAHSGRPSVSGANLMADIQQGAYVNSNMLIPVRVQSSSGYELQWRAIGSLASAVDNISIEVNDDGAGGSTFPEPVIKLKNWHDPSLALASTTLAEDLKLTASGSYDKILVRDSSGKLKFKEIGLGLSPALDGEPQIVTDVEYGYFNNSYCFRITKKKLYINGATLSLKDPSYSYINTVQHL